uniref:PABS domain-containing protein n=1 Tax=Noctiluca scintillans TaxID=2966 RepID=A0A7S1A9D0_NOCSC
MVDIDDEVMNLSRKWLPQLANGSFDDPRLHLITGDAIQFLESSASDPFDVLILDFPDAFEKGAEILYAAAFYEKCRSNMHSGSVLVTQSGPCDTGSQDCELLERNVMTNMPDVFNHMGVMYHPMATWKAKPSARSDWTSLAFAFGDDVGQGLTFDKGLVDEWLAREVSGLRYFSGDVYESARWWPAELERILRRSQQSADGDENS